MGECQQVTMDPHLPKELQFIVYVDGESCIEALVESVNDDTAVDTNTKLKHRIPSARTNYLDIAGEENAEKFLVDGRSAAKLRSQPL